MSYEHKKTFACLPKTERGKPCLIGGDPKNGDKIVYCNEQAVVIRSLSDPSIAELYSEHQVQPTVARFSPNGFYIASGDAAGNVRVWDTINKEHVCKLEQRILAGPLLDIQWGPESKRLVVSGQGREKMGHCFFIDGGNSCGEITGHQKTINSCDFKPNRPYRLATGSEDFHVQWYEGPPFKYKKTFEDHTRFVNCVRFSPDGSSLLTVSSDKNCFLYDGKTGDKKGELKGHSGGVYCCSWSADSKQVLTASADRTCKIWDVEAGTAVTTFQFPKTVEYQQLGCLWQGDYLLSVNLNGEINYLDKNDPSKPSRVIQGHSNFVKSVTFDKASNKIVSASFDHVVCTWDADSGECHQVEGKGHTNDIPSMDVSDGKFYSVSMDDTARVTPVTGSFDDGSFVKLDSPGMGVAAGKGDLSIVATIKSVSVVRGGKVVNTVNCPYGPKSVAINPDNTEVAVGGEDKIIYIYKLSGDTLTESGKIDKQRGEVHAVSYSPDGQSLAAGDTLREVKVYNASTKENTITGWCFHNAKISDLAWSPDSLHIATASLDSTLIVWDVKDTKKKIVIKEAHKLGANGVTWVNNNTITSVGQDACVKTWSLTY